MKTAQSESPRLELGLSAKPLWFSIIAIFAVNWAWMQVLNGGTRIHPNTTNALATHILIVTIGMGLASSAWSTGRVLAVAARILPAMQTPTGLWRTWKKTAMTRLWVEWAVTCAIGTTIFLLSEPDANWTSAMFLYSMALTLGLCASLSRYGVWHWAWSCLIAVSVGTYICLARGESFALLTQVPAAWQVLSICAWPVLAVLLHYYWHSKAPMADDARRIAPIHPWHSAIVFAKRHKAIGIYARRHRKNAGALSWLPFYAMFLMSNDHSYHGWGSQVGLIHLALLVLAIPYVGEMLYCRDLHWRYLLAPNGYGGKHIATHLLMSTATIWGGLMLPLLLVYLLFSWLLLGVLPTTAIASAWHYASYLCEFIFAVCASIALRGFRHWLWIFIAMLCAVVLGCGIALWLASAGLLRPWFAIGPAYIICLVAGSVAAILLANRVWTTRRLLPYIVSTTNYQQSLTCGRWFPWPARRYGEES
ncbi:MAG TPA: hypothetical protein VIF60_08860 [Burkholderiaceae bacterium]|jgi:hypothetical protein